MTIARNNAGLAQHVVVNRRSRTSVLLMARLCAEHFAGTELERLLIPVD